MTTEAAKKSDFRSSIGGWLVSFLLLVLMIAILQVLHRSENVLKEIEKERGVAEARERLQLDLKLLQKSASAEMHFGSFIYHQMVAQYSDLQHQKDWPAKLHDLVRSPLNPVLQKSQWSIMSFDEAAIASETLFADKRVRVRVSKGQAAEKYSEEMKFFCIKGIKTFSNLHIDLDYQKKVGPRLHNLLDSRVASDQTDFIRSAFACFQRLHLHGKPFRLAWFPLSDHKWVHALERFRKIDMQYFDSRDLNIAHLGGIALFLFAEEDFADVSSRYLKHVVRANLARTGCNIEFYEIDSHQMKGSESDDLQLSGRLSLDRDYKIVVSRKSNFDPAVNRLARSIGFSLRIAWFAAGLLLWGHFFVMRRQVSVNISMQLIAFTVWILFPAFYLGYNATERYVLEKQTSTLSGLKKNLADQVRAFDNSLEIYKTWVCHVIERSVDKHFSLEYIDLSDKDGNRKMMQEVKRDLLLNGVFSKNIFLVDGSGNIHSDLFGANKKEKRFFEEFFKAFYLPVISSSAKSDSESKKSGSQLLAGAQAEELVDIARSVLLPEEVSAMAMKTVSLDRLSGMEQQAFIFHKYLGKDKKAFLAIQAGIYMQSVERSCMLDWIEHFQQEKLSGLMWFITRKKAPSWLLRPPFWAANTSGVEGQLVFVADFLAPGLLFLNHQLTQSNVSMTTTIEIGSQEFLLASFSGQKMNEYQLSALIPLQPHKKMLEDFRLKLLWAMAIIFLVSAIIGVRIARSFIEPVVIFAENALQVMTGNFKVRMPEKWEEQEFVSLATNFNQIVANLDSGKTLTKFVSDGALEVIRDTGKLENEYYAIDQAIMFVRLDQFWEKTENLSPEQAVYVLNIFFAMVCREIKKSGGDVSKFIGEKVLAVFNVTGGDSHELAADCALRICREVEQNNDKYRNCRVRIGLSQGKVLAGVIGGEESLLEQTVIGDSVNLASRLCTILSDHSILVNQVLAELLIKNSSRFELKLLPEREIKGKKTPVTIYSLIGYTAG